MKRAGERGRMGPGMDFVAHQSRHLRNSIMVKVMNVFCPFCLVCTFLKLPSKCNFQVVSLLSMFGMFCVPNSQLGMSYSLSSSFSLGLGPKPQLDPSSLKDWHGKREAFLNHFLVTESAI